MLPLACTLFPAHLYFRKPAPTLQILNCTDIPPKTVISSEEQSNEALINNGAFSCADFDKCTLRANREGRM